MTIMLPSDPIAAVTAADPYPYYADLVAQKPIYRDEALNLWVASSASTVTEVLTNDLCRVRPVAEPIPRALIGSPAAEIYRHLVRMNDGERHCPFKQAIVTTFTAIDTTQVAERSGKWARVLLDKIEVKADGISLADFAFHLPVYVIASLLGVPQDKLQQTALWMSEFVYCMTPTSSAEQIERGKVAAGHLLDLFRSLMTAQQDGAAENVLAILKRQANAVGSQDRDVVIANAIGFLWQAYEATAGLIGNSFVALTTRREICEQVLANRSLLPQVIEEVLRYDPPIQNTRRFLAGNGRVAGQDMKEGDGVLVVLAATNRDPAVNANPEQFDVLRKERRIFTFGTGAHACPGEALAKLIAQAGVEQLFASNINPEQVLKTVTYRPSANARIALLATEKDG